MPEPKITKERKAQYSTKVEEDFPEVLTLITSRRPLDLKKIDPENLVTSQEYKKTLPLRYGINPGGPAAFYAEQEATGPNMANFKVLQEGSKGLGYINVADMDVAQGLIRLFHNDYPGGNTYCIIKHEMPSGVGMGITLDQAFDNAWGSDPLSSFGGVHGSSQQIREYVANQLVDKNKNVEVIYAPSFSAHALDILSKRKSLRVVQMKSLNDPSVDGGLEYKSLVGGKLVQPRWETRIHTADDVEVISDRTPTNTEVRAALFNWKVAGFTRSNAVVIGTENRTHGIGSGQKSRIDSAYSAIRYANGRDGTNSSFGAQETFMASDAYMPSTDVVELAAKAGVTGIIFPLGSIMDKEVIKVANEKGLALLATRARGTEDSERCFTHR